MKNEKVKNEKVKWFILDWKVLKVMHQQTLNLHELVSLMDVAWLSIESIVSYYWQWEQSLVMELQSSSLLHCQHYYLLGMSSTCVCICLMEGCVLYTSRQDDYASPGHMAMHISCCRCDISQKHANIFPSISQSVNCVNCICCVSSISDVEFLWCEVVSDWDSLNWVIAWDVTTLSFTCSGLSLQTLSRWQMICVNCVICVIWMFAGQCFVWMFQRRGCIARQLHQWQGAGEFNYCESIQWTQVQAATVQFLNRGHVWVVAILAQNLQDLLHHSFWSIGGSVEFCQAVSIVSFVCHDVGSCCWWLPSDCGHGPRCHSGGMFDWLECVLSCVSII